MTMCSLAVFCPGPWEIGIIAVIAIILFGPWGVRQIFKSGGEVVKAGRSLKKELEDLGKEVGK